MDYKELIDSNSKLSNVILETMYVDEPFTNQERKEKALKDIEWMLQFIYEGIHLDNVRIVENLLLWYKKLFEGLDIDTQHVDLLFSTTKKVLHNHFHSNEIDLFLERVNTEAEQQSSHLLKNNPYAKEKEIYLDALLNSDRKRAQTLVNQLVSDDVSISDIYIYIFQDTMRHIGLLWQEGKIKVGREHYATALTQFLMSTLYPKVFSSEKKDKKLLACTVGSELHEMGIRMVADLFEINGWDTNYLGANLPASFISDFAKQFQPDVIALSVTMPYHLSTLKETIKLIRDNEALSKVKIMVGGFPFLDNESLYKNIGADAYAPNALEGVSIANSLL